MHLLYRLKIRRAILLKAYIKSISKIIIFLIFISALFKGNTEEIEAAVIKLKDTSINLKIGSSKTLSVQGSKKKVRWASSNNKVATVSSGGKVTAMASGTATIYAYVAGKKLSARVTVKNGIAVPDKKQSGSGAKSIESTAKPNESDDKLIVNDKKVPVSDVNPNVTGKIAEVDVKPKGIDKKTPVADAKSNITEAKQKKDDTSLEEPNESSKDPYSKPKEANTNPKEANSKLKEANTKPNGASTKAKSSNEPVAADSKQTTTEPNSTVQDTTPIIADTPPTTAETEPTEENKKNKVHIVGYYAAWGRYSKFTPDKLDADKLSHINYAFANISSDLTIKGGYPDVDEANMRDLVKLKKINPDLKIIIAVGGWTWSGRFSDAALTQKSRDKFADSVVDFIIKYDLDGVDIDWEYPVSGGLAANSRRPEDKHNFTLLMKTLREKLNLRGAIDGKHYILSFAGAAGSWYTKNVELTELSKYVDYANVMTYDIHGTWDANTGFNAPLYNYNGIKGEASVDSGINAWLNAGFPKNKIVMGVPFYGYIYNSVDAENDGLGQLFTGGASISYADIAAKYLKLSEFKRFYHPTAMVPYLYNGSTFISYEDKQSMADKAGYIKEKGLLGAMIWELSQDPDRVLFNSLYKGLK